VLQCVAVRCRALQCVAVCRSVLQCVAVCCCVLQCVAVSLVCRRRPTHCLNTAAVCVYGAVCCSVLQCVTVWCSVLHGVTVCYSMVQYVACVCVYACTDGKEGRGQIGDGVCVPTDVHVCA